MVYVKYHHRPPSASKLKKTFLKYASHTMNGVYFMTGEDFIRRYIEVFPNTTISDELLRVLTQMADTNHDGWISYEEYEQFERLLWSPDALYVIAFRLFDCKGNNNVSFTEFTNMVKITELYGSFPFNFDSIMIKQYFGSDKQRVANFNEFGQLLRDFAEEYTRQSFQNKDDGTGFIKYSDFEDIMIGVKRRLLTGEVANMLGTITNGDKVSYAFFKTFTSLLDNIESVKYIYLEATGGSRRKQITRDDLLIVGQTKGFTPFQADILYRLMKQARKQDTVCYKDLCQITPQNDEPVIRSVFVQILESLYRFTLGSIAGATGAFCVYPIDLVKTRMQNQRIIDGVRMYNNIFDCAVKVVRNEGFFGLYRGVPVQMLGIAPEKAINLTVNDFVRGKGTDEKGNISLGVQILAGCSAGFCQDLISNPLEIVKIRLQTAGEEGERARALDIIRELGPRGLYKGIKACLLRDVPFAGIYFTTYGQLKRLFQDENGYNSPITLLYSGFLSGIPAASLVTPADVIKTRLQVVEREGKTTYTGVIDAAIKIMREEGPTAFWKGVVPRVLRSSPQLGITLITYELLQRLLYVDFGGHRPEGSEKKHKGVEDHVFTINPDHIGGYKRVVPILNSIESKFGLCLPRFGRPVK